MNTGLQIHPDGSVSGASTVPPYSRRGQSSGVGLRGLYLQLYIISTAVWLLKFVVYIYHNIMSCSPQIQPGSGWHLEPYMGSSNRTLVSYVAHVSVYYIMYVYLCAYSPI